MKKRQSRIPKKLLILTLSLVVMACMGSMSFASEGSVDVSGDHILYIPYSGDTAAVLMAQGGSRSGTIRAKVYKLIKESNTIDTSNADEAPSVWYFQSAGNSAYYIASTVDQKELFLTIDGNDAYLSDEAQPIFVETREDGSMKLTNEAGQTLSLRGGDVAYGFDAHDASDEDAWFYTAVTTDITIAYTYSAAKGSAAQMPETTKVTTTARINTVAEPVIDSYKSTKGDGETYYFEDWLGSDGKHYLPGDTLNLNNYSRSTFVLHACWTEEPMMRAMGEESEAPAVSEEGTEVGDFLVIGNAANYSVNEKGDLQISGGTVEVRNKDGVEVTSQHIEVVGDAKLILNGVSIETTQGVLISPIRIAPGVNAELVLKTDSVNTVSGTEFKHDGYKTSGVAGVEVGIEEENGVATNLSTLTISGEGKLIATGGQNAAGIGGSKTLSSKAAHGNIIIESGTIEAYAGDGGAGIGTASNMNSQLSNGSYKSSFSWGSITINGGNIKAVSESASGAGIGGGNHVDSGNITINGGTIDASGYSGIGSGLGSSKSKNEADKGPGHYFATVTINGGTIVARGLDIGAGIGGAMYCDAIITITGGDVTAYAGSARGKATHGGAAIGGGYQGHAKVTITGGNIKAYAGENSGAAGIGSGTAANSHSLHSSSKDGRSDASKLEYTTVNISGGTVYAEGGALGGAGIGTGVGSDKGVVTITGGTVTAIGGKSTEEKKAGGAGIGSAYAGKPYTAFDQTTGEDPSSKYFVFTNTEVSITDGKVLSIGGWGASGIGSGAENKMANQIDIKTASAGGAAIEAYADGTKFAIDTRVVTGDHTVSQKEGRTIDGNLLQGTFVHKYTSKDDVNQGTEALGKIVVRDSLENDVRVLTGMKKYELVDGEYGYRSFATDVDRPGYYTVFTDDTAIAEGEGRYFNKCIDDTRTPEDVQNETDIEERNVQYRVTGNSLCDNFYLFPVKTIIVTKNVTAEDDVKKGLNLTLKYALWNDNDKAYVKDRSDASKIWTESIELVNGVPQNKAYFACVDEGTYGIWEMDDEGNELSPGTPVKENTAITLTEITTVHGDTNDNDATIDDDTWIDRVTVNNKYTQEEPDDPGTLIITKRLSEDSDEVEIPGGTAFTIEGPDDYMKTITYQEFDQDGKYMLEDLAPGSYKVTEDISTAAVDGYVLAKTVYIVGEDKGKTPASVEVPAGETAEVTIENTYLCDTAHVTIKKSIPQYFDASATSNATFVFKVTIYRTYGQPMTEYYAFDFTKAGTQSMTIELDDASTLVKAEVTEVYGAGYDVQGTVTRTVDLSDASLGNFTVSFDNKYDPSKVTEGSGVINNYQNGHYKGQSFLRLFGL